MGDKLPEMTDQQPLPVESTVLRQLPHFAINTIEQSAGLSGTPDKFPLQFWYRENSTLN
jgi:hypothetical protein